MEFHPAAEEVSKFEKRKEDHIKWSLDSASQTTFLSKFDKIKIHHNAIPEIDDSDIDISSSRLSNSVASPFFVSSMTAGHEKAKDINANIARACGESGWWFAVGSQRRELFDKEEINKWNSFRKEFPDIHLLGNIGLSQLIDVKNEEVLALIDNIGAKAFFIHTNPLQESIQLEGTPYFKGGLKAIEDFCKLSPVPVILKETGCGFSKKNFLALRSLGLSAVDISGLGGTHWGRLEGFRLEDRHPKRLAAEVFKDWGVSTVDSLLWAKELELEYEVWASGGIRNGLHAFKSLVLGATAVGVAQPIMVGALKSWQEVLNTMQQLELELRIAMFNTGCKDIDSISQVEYSYE